MSTWSSFLVCCRITSIYVSVEVVQCCHGLHVHLRSACVVQSQGYCIACTSGHSVLLLPDCPLLICRRSSSDDTVYGLAPVLFPLLIAGRILLSFACIGSVLFRSFLFLPGLSAYPSIPFGTTYHDRTTYSLRFPST